MDALYETDDEKSKKPNPADFDKFLPWACSQLQINECVQITKIVQSDYLSMGQSDRSKKKVKSRVSKNELDMDKGDQSFAIAPPITLNRDSGVHIQAIYDNLDHLIQLKFLNNKSIPRVIFKIMILIIPHYSYLSSITINKGLDEYTLYEISKFLPHSHITDICLDNTYLKEANYSILLEQRSDLRHLSLSRCSLNDTVIKALAATLIHPFPASQSLSILNLSSNRITDEGAKLLAEVLRSNRKLSYLNLSDNNLTDCGSEYLLNTLLKFPLTFTELLVSRSRHMAYLKEKNVLIMQIVRELRIEDSDKRTPKRKSPKAVATSRKKGLEREGSAKVIPENKSFGNIDSALIEKAAIMAEKTLGTFNDSFDKENTIVQDKIVYSKGNNTLLYLNLAYNNLTYITVQKLLSVLNYQKETGRRQRGLINICIEGNYMPISCKELNEIEGLIEMSLMVQNRRLSLSKKRPLPKSGTR